ncbi:alpha/beta fold hydrolase [Arenibacterium sp. CAU 1754]
MTLPLVLLPEMMCDARLFSAQINALSRDHTVMVAPVTQESRIEAIARGLLNKLPTRFALFGMGMGGSVAMEILRQVPDRIDRLCLMGTSPLPDTPDMAAAREPLIVRAQAGRLTEMLGEVMKPDYFAPTANRDQTVEQVHQMGYDLGLDVFVRQNRAMQRRSDQQGTLRRAKVPTLVLCGEHDTLTPIKRHEFMAGLMHDAGLYVIPDAGHFPPLEQPDHMTEILRSWLAQPMVLR